MKEPTVSGTLCVTVVEGANLGKPESSDAGASGFTTKKKRGKGKKKAQAAAPGERDTPPAPLSPQERESNVYVRVCLLNECKDTAALGSAAPKWNETFAFTCASLTVSTSLVFNVLDRDDRAGLLGAKTFPLEELVASKGTNQWVPLDRETSDNGAEPRILVSMSWTPAPESSPDTVDNVVEKLSGPRPNLLRFGYGYGAIKDAYSYCSGLPLVRNVTPLLEKTAETILSKTPLKASPESAHGGQSETKAVANLDKSIAGALEVTDGTLDEWKDWLLGRIKSGKDGVKNLKPKDKTIVEASMDGVKHGVDTTTGAVGNAYNATTGAIGGAVHSVFSTVGGWVSGLYQGTCNTMGGAYSATTNAAGSAYSATTDAAGRAVGGIKSTAGSAVDGVKGAAGSAVNGVKGAASGVYDTAAGVAGRVVGKKPEIFA